MRLAPAALIVGSCLGIALVGDRPAAHAQMLDLAPTLALKNGESFELGPLYWVSHCKSLLTSTPEAEVLDGPPGVTVSVKDAMVIPRRQNCTNKVAGGIVSVAAKDIQDPGTGQLTVRFTYKTRDGERKFSQVFNISVLP
jgi:hypothetical protein